MGRGGGRRFVSLDASCLSEKRDFVCTPNSSHSSSLVVLITEDSARAFVRDAFVAGKPVANEID